MVSLNYVQPETRREPRDPHGCLRGISSDTLPARILIVDDDTELRRMVADYLEGQNMRAPSVTSREEMLRHFTASEPWLVIFDLQLDQDDGFDLLCETPARSDVPVIIITGNRRDETDRVVELEFGADDYVTKPFGRREQLARMRAVLRRDDLGRAALQRDTVASGYRFAGWQLDHRTRSLSSPNGAPVPLTKSQYAHDP
jgi:DNA-binding response OmpR family regulator